jgi:hypothetical protein
VDPASSCSIRAARSRCVSPLTPTPLPCQGRGELDADSGRKADSSPPLPFEGRGDGGEGSKNPARASSTLARHCGSSIFVQYPWCVWQVRFTPHPDPLPFQGRGELDADFRAKADSQPPLPFEGRGDGGEGSRDPCPRLVNACGAVWIQRPRALSVQRVAGAFHPSPPTLSPSRGEGSWMRIQGEKQSLTPSPLRGERGWGEG